MNKLVVILLFLCQVGYSQIKLPKVDVSGIHMTGFAETGFENRQITFGGNGFYNMGNNYFSTLQTGVALKGFNLYGQVKTYYLHENLLRYIPKQVEYKVGLLWSFKSFDLNICHFCSHGIDNDMFYDTYNQISVKYNIK